MVEKPNKDGRPPTIEYQEEEILVRLILLHLLFVYVSCLYGPFEGIQLFCADHL